MRFLIVGPSQSGKDEAAEWFRDNAGMTYGGSTSRYICAHIAPELGMTEKQAFDCRHRYRQKWKVKGDQLRENDPGYFVKASLARGNICAGVRDKCELEYAVRNRSVDWIMWIRRPGYEKDPSLTFTIEDCEGLCHPIYAPAELTPKFLIMHNTGTLATFHNRLAAFAKWLGIC